MENMFEKTMLTCIQSRVSNSKNKNKLSESVRRVKPITEAEELDLTSDPEDQNVMDDIQDDVVVVVDPELDTDEVEGTAAKAKDIIDNTPEGEVPSTDDYVGDMTYICPICGNTFFSEVAMNDGDPCPVCGETPNAFVLVGKVEDVDNTDTEEKVIDTDVNEVDNTEVNTDELDDNESEDIVVNDDTEVDTDVETDEELECATPLKSDNRLQIDDDSFNTYMDRFVRENYKNARSFRIVGANLNKNKVLTLECVINYKSGNKKRVKLTTEGFRTFNGKRAYIDFKENGAFKTESKKSPFVFKTSMRNNVIKCEGMRYNFITRISESKKAHIFGNVILESRRPVKR